MGTDIYLKWKGQTAKQKQDQFTGFDITKGNIGYLRASIGMTRENQTLRLIFPEKHWEGKELTYDFSENIELIFKAISSYLSDGDIDVQGREKPQQQHGQIIVDFFKGQGGVVVNVNDLNSDDDDKKLWAKSVMEFCMKGVGLQKKGLKPKVYITW